jgi:hypothetical protein
MRSSASMEKVVEPTMSTPSRSGPRPGVAAALDAVERDLALRRAVEGRQRDVGGLLGLGGRGVVATVALGPGRHHLGHRRVVHRGGVVHLGGLVGVEVTQRAAAVGLWQVGDRGAEPTRVGQPNASRGSSPPRMQPEALSIVAVSQCLK